MSMGWEGGGGGGWVEGDGGRREGMVGGGVGMVVGGGEGGGKVSGDFEVTKFSTLGKFLGIYLIQYCTISSTAPLVVLCLAMVVQLYIYIYVVPAGASPSIQTLFTFLCSKVFPKWVANSLPLISVTHYAYTNNASCINF